MTGGTAVILGRVGDNFAAGMTGGMAFVWDAEDGFLARVNHDTVVVQRVETPHWEGVLLALVEEHVRQTGSPLARELLRNWDGEIRRFWQICPKEMVGRLEHPLSQEVAAAMA
jgi:glutamate synthase (NADPH/NADH) large chain